MATDDTEKPPGKRDKLQRMREQRDALNARIRQAEARAAKSERDEDTRLKVLIGAAVKWQAEHETECMTWLRKLFFDFYPQLEKHADKHELFDRLMKPVSSPATTLPPEQA